MSGYEKKRSGYSRRGHDNELRPLEVIVDNGNVVVGQTMNATISADPRVGDGAEAAIFLSEFQKTLENPVRLML